MDAASSFELLSHLNRLADSNRTVILTIHQPRLEIFHMFHRLVLLSDGKVTKHATMKDIARLCIIITFNNKSLGPIGLIQLLTSPEIATLAMHLTI